MIWDYLVLRKIKCFFFYAAVETTVLIDGQHMVDSRVMLAKQLTDME
jgi:hypothetical protein